MVHREPQIHRQSLQRLLHLAFQRKTEAQTTGVPASGPAWEYDKTTDMYFLHLFSKKQPDLNWDNPAVRQDVFDMMNWWLKRGLTDSYGRYQSHLQRARASLTKKLELTVTQIFNVSANGPLIHEYLQEMRQKALNNADTITV